ncbi:MAG: hypothetical protein HRT87_11870 [Legionellales bacterium]|nr:hypothetical protein [Legionellales bacterium]
MYKLIILITILFQTTLFAQVELLDDEYMNAYIVIADNGLDYVKMQDRMLDLSNEFKLDVDTMGRIYNVTKDLISLPIDDEDEIYAGEYFPRRYPSTSLSLEYLDYYDEKKGEKVIGLVAGIFDNKADANNLLKRIKTQLGLSIMPTP